MEPAPRAGRRRSPAAGLRRERPSLHSSSGSRRPRTRPCTRPAAGEGARARAGAAAGAASSRKAAGATGGPRSALQRPAAPAPLPARGGGGAEPAGLSFPAARASRLPPGAPAPSLARSLPAPALSAPSSTPAHPTPSGDPPPRRGGHSRPQANHRPAGRQAAGCGGGGVLPPRPPHPPAGLPVAPRGSRGSPRRESERTCPSEPTHPLQLPSALGKGRTGHSGALKAYQQGTRNTQSIHLPVAFLSGALRLESS